MARCGAYDSQRGTNHQLSTLLSLCTCTCDSQSLVLAWTTPSSTTKSPIVGGIFAPWKQKELMFDTLKFHEVSACTNKTSSKISKLPRLGECAWQVLAELERLGDVCDHWFTLGLKLYHCCRCHCKALCHHEPKGNKKLDWTKLPTCTRGSKECTDRTGDESRLDLGQNICEPIPHTFDDVWTGWSNDIWHTEAHTSNFLVEAW